MLTDERIIALTVTTKGQVMDDNAVSNITQILTSFDNFVSILENPVWVRSAKAEDIKNGFKLGSFIEKSLTHFRTNNLAFKFFNVLNQWWRTEKNRTKVYDEDFFQFACDQLLSRFFQCEETSEVSLEVAIRVYTSIFPKKRLKKVISSLILTSSSREASTDFTKANMTDIELKDLAYSLVLNNWSNILKTGRDSDVQKEIESKLSMCEVESTLYLMIGILSLRTVTDSEKLIQNIVLENLLQKMLDRSLLSKSFWLTMFKKVELQYICRACENFNDFLVSLFNFIVYIGSMMKNEDGMWQSDETVSLCPEITYQEVMGLIKNIHNTNTSLKQFVNQRVNDARENTDSFIWQKIQHELCL